MKKNDSMELKKQSMKNDSMEQRNQSLKNQSDEAQKSKANLIDPTDKKLHAPNRPSI